jgi:hypothetical protein
MIIYAKCLTNVANPAKPTGRFFLSATPAKQCRKADTKTTQPRRNHLAHNGQNFDGALKLWTEATSSRPVE